MLRNDKIDPKYVDAIKLVASGINCLPQFSDGVVLRGSDILPTDVLSQYEEGNIVLHKAFTSTSKERLTEAFSTLPIQFTIYNTQGAKLHLISFTPEENEILIQAGSKFEVLSKRKKGEHIYIEMTQLKESSPDAKMSVR